MDTMLAAVPAESFANALPGGNPQSAQLDAAHTTTRRAERDVVAMDRRYSVSPIFKQYLNRLSDYLLVAARYSDHLFEKERDEKPAPVIPPVSPVTAPAVAPVTLSTSASESLPLLLNRENTPASFSFRVSNMFTPPPSL